MARTSLEIKASITNDFINRPEIIALYGLVPGQTFEQQFSVASLENQFFDTVANDMAVHEQLVEANTLNSKLHTVNWYKKTAMSFLDGLPLVWITDDQFGYDLSGVTDADIRQIIDRCAVLPSNGRLVIKIATDNGGVIEPLTTAQLNRFIAYMNLVKDAGTNLVFVNDPGDKLKIEAVIQVDIATIDLDTGRLLSVPGSVFPVRDAIDNYLKNLEFNGAVVRTFLEDAIQAAPGVKNLRIDNLQSKFAGFSFTDIADGRIPNAGYFVLDNTDIILTYTANELSSY